MSEGLLEYKPASQAVALNHKGVVETERQSDEVSPESQRTAATSGEARVGP